MDKTLKGAVAALGAGALLMGGAGTVAYWNATDTNDPGVMTAGSLKLLNETGQWTLNGVVVADETAVRMVPGDLLTYAGEYEIDAVGDNLEATVSVVGGDEAGALSTYVDTTTVFELAGGALPATITDANDGQTLSVDIDIDFPFGVAADNDSQDLTLDLTAVDVELTQTDATP